MQIITVKISLNELKKMAENSDYELVKAVVDIEKGIMVVDAPLHSDQERLLLEKGSKQQNLWGINIYPSNTEEDFIEFDSMINIRPGQDNRTRSVESPQLREKIIKIINKLVKR